MLCLELQSPELGINTNLLCASRVCRQQPGPATAARAVCNSAGSAGGLHETHVRMRTGIIRTAARGYFETLT